MDSSPKLWPAEMLRLVNGGHSSVSIPDIENEGLNGARNSMEWQSDMVSLVLGITKATPHSYPEIDPSTVLDQIEAALKSSTPNADGSVPANANLHTSTEIRDMNAVVSDVRTDSTAEANPRKVGQLEVPIVTDRVASLKGENADFGDNESYPMPTYPLRRGSRVLLDSGQKCDQIQDPPPGAFDSTSLEWFGSKSNIAFIPFLRLSDFLNGENFRDLFNTSFTIRQTNTSTDPKTGDVLQRSRRFSCCFGPTDSRGSKRTDCLDDKASISEEQESRCPTEMSFAEKRGCRCAFSVVHFVKHRPDALMITWHQRDHLDKNKEICHGFLLDETAHVPPRIAMRRRHYVERPPGAGLNATKIINSQRDEAMAVRRKNLKKKPQISETVDAEVEVCNGDDLPNEAGGEVVEQSQSRRNKVKTGRNKVKKPPGEQEVEKSVQLKKQKTALNVEKDALEYSSPTDEGR